MITCLRPLGRELLFPLKMMLRSLRPRPLGKAPGLAGTGVEGSALPLPTLKSEMLLLTLMSRPLIPVPGRTGTGSGCVVAVRPLLLGSLLRPQLRQLPALHTPLYSRRKAVQGLQGKPTAQHWVFISHPGEDGHLGKALALFGRATRRCAPSEGVAAAVRSGLAPGLGVYVEMSSHFAANALVNFSFKRALLSHRGREEVTIRHAASPSGTITPFLPAASLELSSPIMQAVCPGEAGSSLTWS